MDRKFEKKILFLATVSTAKLSTDPILCSSISLYMRAVKNVDLCSTQVEALVPTEEQVSLTNVLCFYP
jgi:hypothetical protein